MISLFGLDPATYRQHPLHDGERTYQETNCFADCVIELVAAAGHEPEAMLAGTAAVDFEVDQWTFFKPAPEDLVTLYGLDLHEMQPYRSIPEQTAARLALGQTTMPEVDSYWLPDVAATDYRTNHVKSSIVIEGIDPDARVLRYFHNAGYFELSGEDYDGLFAEPALPPYVELVRFGVAPALSGDALRDAARVLLADSLGRRPADNPFDRFLAALEADLPRLLEGDEADYHAYAFHNPRMAGASFELLASHVRWLLGEEGEQAAAALDDVVGGTKMLLFRLARRRAFDVAGVVGPMAEGYATAMTELDRLVS
ncbi:DUF1839 family protein [Nocardioides sp.]|uniref:DUF1839 family protein n=1 Tax=Nocardioides sp. TaxID=35761 RepID=UPI001A1D4E4A|nr:DUF1839 family protein [Nocardioides sp.]MBJ7356467.1 DUF1839 family protein [Nocardioides sp.]